MIYGNLKNNYDNNNDLYTPDLCASYVLAENYIEDYVLLDEGANIEITKSVLTFKKNYHNYIRDAKKNMKAGDKKAAAKNIKDARNELSKFRKEVKDMESDKWSVSFGIIASAFIVVIKYSALIFAASLLSTVLGNTQIASITGLSVGLSAAAEDSKTLQKSINNKETEKGSLNAMNSYRTTMLGLCDKLDSSLSKLESELNKK